MRPFDKTAYRRAVMAVAVATGEDPDFFVRYGLDYADADDDAIRTRMEEVRLFWNKDKGKQPRYREIYTRLIDEHDAAGLVLLDSRQREKTANELQTASETVLQEALGRLERATHQAVDAHGGLPLSIRANLEEYGQSLDIPTEVVIARLAAHPVVAEAQADGLPVTTRTQIRQALRAFAKAVDDPPRGRSLYHFLQVRDPDAAAADIERRWRELASENRSRKENDHVQLPVQQLLGFVKTWLIDKGASVYRAAFRMEVQDELRKGAIEKSIDDRRLDELEAQQLLEQAIELGLAQDEARGAVVAVAHELGVSVEFGTAVDYVACAGCAKAFRVNDAPERCTRCGTALFRACPSCGTRCQSSDPACGSCGFKLAAAREADRLVESGRAALAAGRPAGAMAAARMARAAVGDHAQALDLEREAGAACSAAEKAWAQVEEALARRRPYEASRLLYRLAREASDISGPSGAEPGERLDDVNERVRRIDERLASARELPSDPARERAFARLLEEAEDSRVAADELAAIPPQAPQGVHAAVSTHGVHIGWSPCGSPGAVEYVVVRGEGEAPSGLRAGREVGRTREHEIEDRETHAGSLVGYAVVATRAGAASPPARSEPLLVTREVSDLAVREGDAEVTLSWRPPGGRGSVRVERHDLHSGERAVLETVGAGLRDREVRNGRRYRYRVLVEYLNGPAGTTATAGLEVLAAPAARPAPVVDLEIQTGAKGLRLTWTAPPGGTVQLVRCRAEPTAAVGDDFEAHELEALGELVHVQGDEAFDRSPGDEVVWYLPVTLAGGHAVAGRAHRCVALPDITGVKALDLGELVRVTWEWPERCSMAVIAWRRDRRPGGPDDPGAERRSITRAEYRDIGGVEIPLGTGESLFVAVYPSIRRDGEVLHGSAVGQSGRAALRRQPVINVRYTINRSGRLKRRLELVASSDGPLPALVLVARPGDLLPMSADEGRVVAKIGGAGDSPSTARLELDTKALGTPVALRMFLAGTHSRGGHRLYDPDASNLILR